MPCLFPRGQWLFRCYLTDKPGPVRYWALFPLDWFFCADSFWLRRSCSLGSPFIQRGPFPSLMRVSFCKPNHFLVFSLPCVKERLCGFPELPFPGSRRPIFPAAAPHSLFFLHHKVPKFFVALFQVSSGILSFSLFSGFASTSVFTSSLGRATLSRPRDDGATC